MKRKIIIVDDSKVGPILEDILKNERGHHAKLYISGFEAIVNIGETSSFDLVLVDVGLPDMPGEKVIEYLRDKYPTKSIICISSYQGFESRAATRTIHKGSASKIRGLIDVLENYCLK